MASPTLESPASATEELALGVASEGKGGRSGLERERGNGKARGRNQQKINEIMKANPNKVTLPTC